MMWRMPWRTCRVLGRTRKTRKHGRPLSHQDPRDLAAVAEHDQVNSWIPRVHHMKVAKQVLGYLWGTSHYALELGGGELGIVGFSDSSHGPGKEGRSVNGSLVKLSKGSGAIVVKTVRSKSVRLSSFEYEMEALNNTVKLVSWAKALVKAVIRWGPMIYCDNEVLVNNVRGNLRLYQ
jgi:hypothetical protein